MEELFALYETANRCEPHYYTTTPTAFRTKADPLPFSRIGPFEWGPVSPGYECVDADAIPGAVDDLLAFVARGDVEEEWRAFASYFLAPRIHPFRDGNGHFSRMLVASLLASRYSRERLLLLNAHMQEKRPEIMEYQRGIQLGEAGVRDLVSFLLELL